MAEKFVKMVKEGEEPIKVHPSVVDDHKHLGWKVAAEEQASTNEDAVAEAKKKKEEAKAKAKAEAEAKKAEAKAVLEAKGK